MSEKKIDKNEMKRMVAAQRRATRMLKSSDSDVTSVSQAEPNIITAEARIEVIEEKILTETQTVEVKDEMFMGFESGLSNAIVPDAKIDDIIDNKNVKMEEKDEMDAEQVKTTNEDEIVCVSIGEKIESEKLLLTPEQKTDLIREVIREKVDDYAQYKFISDCALSGISHSIDLFGKKIVQILALMEADNNYMLPTFNVDGATDIDLLTKAMTKYFDSLTYNLDRKIKNMLAHLDERIVSCERHKFEAALAKSEYEKLETRLRGVNEIKEMYERTIESQKYYLASADKRIKESQEREGGLRNEILAFEQSSRIFGKNIQILDAQEDEACESQRLTHETLQINEVILERLSRLERKLDQINDKAPKVCDVMQLLKEGDAYTLNQFLLNDLFVVEDENYKLHLTMQATKSGMSSTIKVVEVLQALCDKMSPINGV